MSFLEAYPLSPTTGEPVAADEIMTALDTLSAQQRTFLADVVGPCWLGGTQAQSVEVPQAIGASVNVGVVAPLEARVTAGGAAGLGLSVRSRQPVGRQLVLTPNAHQTVVVAAEGADETAAVVFTVVGLTMPPTGAVALAWIATDFERVTSVLDMRVLPWIGLSSKSTSATVFSAVTFQELTDARVAVLVETGDKVLVEFAAMVTDKSPPGTAPFPEVQFMLFDSTAGNNFAPDFDAPAITGPVALCGSTNQTKHRLFWHGLYVPNQPGTHLLDMRCRAVHAEISDAVLTAMVIRADRPAS